MSQETVTGTIELSGDVAAFSGATLRIFLEDVGMMDAPAKPVAEYIDRNFAYHGAPISFKLSGNIKNPNGRYNVRVHISRDGSSDMKSGDFISTQSYPVLTQDYPSHVTISVQKI